MSLGKCTECGLRGTTYSWSGSLPLSRAVCPIHGTPLDRTTTPKRGLVELQSSPRARDPKALARRSARVPAPWSDVTTVVLAEQAR